MIIFTVLIMSKNLVLVEEILNYVRKLVNLVCHRNIINQMLIKIVMDLEFIVAQLKCYKNLQLILLEI